MRTLEQIRFNSRSLSKLMHDSGGDVKLANKLGIPISVVNLWICNGQISQSYIKLIIEHYPELTLADIRSDLVEDD